MVDFRFSEAPAEPPPQKTRPEDGSYREIPWYRRSGTNTCLIILQIVTLGFLPLIFVTCLALVTGDIYYNQRTPDGKLKKWGNGNKVIAVVILLANVLFWIAVVVSLST